MQIHGWEMLDQHKDRVAQLQKGSAQVVNSVGIEKIKAMFLEMQKLENPQPLDIAEIVQEIESEESEKNNDDQLDESDDFGHSEST